MKPTTIIHRTYRPMPTGGLYDTIGDRVMQLLRDRGRIDRGNAYSQAELVAMLNGEMAAPDGRKRYVKTNRSTISRMINDKMKYPPLDILIAMCEMFDTDLEWLARGNVAQGEPGRPWHSDEAYTVAALVDNMPESFRRNLAALLQELHDARQREIAERRQLDIEIAQLLQENISILESHQRRTAVEYIDRLEKSYHPQ